MLMLIATIIVVFVVMCISYITNARANNQHRALKGDIHSSWRYVQKEHIIHRDTYVIVAHMYGKED